MNNRDRLVELLKAFKIKCNKFTCERNYNCQAHGFEQFADYLIANGVTVPVRCKECIYFQPDFIEMSNGKRRPYTQEEKEIGFVSIKKGINCASRCERYGYWERNNIPVWFNENDYCSYGVRKENGDE